MFAKPEMLGLLAVTLPLLTWFLWVSWRRRERLIAGFVQSRLLAQLTVGVSRNRQKARQVLLVFAVSLMLIALARPQLGVDWEEARQRGLDLAVAVDLSRSMMAQDLPPDRLSRAKLAALDLMGFASADRLALIAFAGEAVVRCPLTLDDNAFAQSVNTLAVGPPSQGSTALAEAIQTSLSVFADQQNNHKVLVLLTDGEDQAEGAIAAAEDAAAAGLRIYPVGVGTAAGDVLRVRRSDGTENYVTDTNGDRVVSRLNESLLRELAQVTGGHYLPLSGTATMGSLYETWLSALPKSDLSSRLSRRLREQFQWPLGLAVLLLVLEMFVSDRRRVEKAPAVLRDGKGNENMPQATVILTLLCLVPIGRAGTDAAWSAYWSGDYATAQVEYERLLTERPEDPRLLFNAGTAAYRNGEFELAIRALSGAIRSSEPELLALAYYNLGNARYRAGEAQVLSAETIQDWRLAIEHYESALKLSPEDQDSQFNHDFVFAKLEALKRDLTAQRRDDGQAKDAEEPGKAEAASDSPVLPASAESDHESGSEEPGDTDNGGQPQDTDPAQAPAPTKDETEDESNTTASNEAEEGPGASPASPDPLSPPGGRETELPQLPTPPPGQMTPAQARQVLAVARSEERAAPLPPRRKPTPQELRSKNW